MAQEERCFLHLVLRVLPETTQLYLSGTWHSEGQGHKCTAAPYTIPCQCSPPLFPPTPTQSPDSWKYIADHPQVAVVGDSLASSSAFASSVASQLIGQYFE